jgi:transcription antitermination factor NusG
MAGDFAVRNRPRHPKFISDDEMRVMLGELNRVIKINPRKSFGIGDLVRITGGPFADHRVIVNDIRGQKAHISLTVLGSTRDIEIGVAQLEAA